MDCERVLEPPVNPVPTALEPPVNPVPAAHRVHRVHRGVNAGTESEGYRKVWRDDIHSAVEIIALMRTMSWK